MVGISGPQRGSPAGADGAEIGQRKANDSPRDAVQCGVVLMADNARRPLLSS